MWGVSVRMPKKRGLHPDKALTALAVRNLAQPGRYADGNGLYLMIDTSGARRWLLRLMVQGRRRDIGLGSAKLVSLAEAREKALHFRKIARDGGDPLAERDNLRAVPTFAEAAERVHDEQVRFQRRSQCPLVAQSRRCTSRHEKGGGRSPQLEGPYRVPLILSGSATFHASTIFTTD